MLKVVIATLLCVGLVNGGKVNFTECASAKLATINEFSVSDCEDGSSHCELIPGIEYNFEIVATAHADHPEAPKVDYRVATTISGLPIVFLEGDACGYTKCPVHPGSIIIAKFTFKIPESLPKGDKIPLRVSIRPNRFGEDFLTTACAQVDVSIKNK